MLRIRLGFFTLFLASGIFTSLMTLFYSAVLKFTSFEVGILSAVSPVMGFIFTPLWALLADKSQSHRKILVINSLLSPLIGFCLYSIAFLPINPSLEFSGRFWIAFFVIILLSIFTCSISSNWDTIVLESIKQDNGRKGDEIKGSYGRYRAIGSLSWGIGAFTMASIVDPLHSKMEAIFWGYFIMSFAFVAVLKWSETSFLSRLFAKTIGGGISKSGVTQFQKLADIDDENMIILKDSDTNVEIRPEENRNGFGESLKLLMTNKSVHGSILVFWAFVFAQGLVLCIPGNFLFIMMKESMDTDQIVIGMVVMSRIALEIPFFYWSDKVGKIMLECIKLFPSSRAGGLESSVSLRWIMFLSAIILSLRMGVTALVGYFSLSPWILVGSEMTHGIIFASFYSSAVQIASEIAPAHLKGLSQGIFNAMMGGLGPFVGSLAGGAIYGAYGPSALFAATSIFTFSYGLLYAFDIYKSK